MFYVLLYTIIHRATNKIFIIFASDSISQSLPSSIFIQRYQSKNGYWNTFDTYNLHHSLFIWISSIKIITRREKYASEYYQNAHSYSKNKQFQGLSSVLYSVQCTMQSMQYLRTGYYLYFTAYYANGNPHSILFFKKR